MVIDEALKIFGYSKAELISLDMAVHKTRYKQLIKAYHPDLYTHRDDVDINAINNAAKLINEANDLLENAIIIAKPLERHKTESFIIIPFSALMSLYGGEVIKATGTDGKSVELSKCNFRSQHIFLEITCNIQYDGVDTVKSWIVPVSNVDKYNVDFSIAVDSLENETVLHLKVCDKSPVIQFSGLACKLNLEFDYGVYLGISIVKCLIDKD